MKLLLFLLCLVIVVTAKKQGIAVKGGLLCDGQFLPDAKIHLYDVDRLPGDSDDKMGEAKSGSLGRFQVYGTTFELTAIEPEIRIYHKCKLTKPNCYRKIVRQIPQSYIYDSEANKRFYDIGTLEVGEKFETEDTICDKEASDLVF